MLIDANFTPAPSPTPITDPLKVAIDGGSLYESVSVELQPKA
jgi:hypothetical protein